jgi:G3E family GTPase
MHIRPTGRSRKTTIPTHVRPSFRPSVYYMSTTSASTADHQQEEKYKQRSFESNNKVPITLLSGFLGSGKTSTLQHLLENTEGYQIGVIVNDVASVNIDAKLVSAAAATGRENTSHAEIMELQNGCACCSLADELLTTVDTLLESRQHRRHQISPVISNDDSNDKNNNDIKKSKFDALVIELSGVADPVAIRSNWNDAIRKGHAVTTKAEIQHIVTLVDASTFGTDWMSWDDAGERVGWVNPADECAASRKVPELLAEQVEAADVVLMNKIDLAGPKQVKVASALARSINEKAVMEEVQYGRVSPQQILGRQNEISVAVDDCNDPDCTDTNHSHTHAHEHTETISGCTDPDCTDTTHSHSLSHSHDKDNVAAATCIDPDRTDPSHSHEHSHSPHANTDVDNLGITNFVYRADRPFNAKKLLPLLSTWPVPVKNDLDLDLLNDAIEDGYTVDGVQVSSTSSSTASPFVGVLRSKGFCWLAPTRWMGGPGADPWRHDTAMYWSHAGKHFGISAAGKWWGTISKEQMKHYFQADPAEYNRILSEDFVSEEFGDRRQELVFIGVGIDQDEITKALDDCLLQQKGMERYRQELSNYMNAILTAGGSGLFDVGRVDHMDI